MDIKTEKKEAARFLNQKGRRVDLVFFGLILIFVWMAPVFIYSYVAYLVSTLMVGVFGGIDFTQAVAMLLSLIAPALGALLAILFLIFVTSPVMHRFFLFSYRMHRCGVAGRCEFFGGGRREYSKSLSSGFVCVSVMVICMIPPIVAQALAKLMVNSPDKIISALGQGIFVLVILLGIFLGFCVFLLFRPLFLFGYFSAKGETVGASLKKSCKIMKSKGAKNVYKSYIKSFAPSLLLAIPTFLVLFFIDTLPKMITVYHRLCDEIVYGDEI